MTKREIDLFKSLCSFKAEKFDETLLDSATPAVLGQLFFNRMQAVAYGVLQKNKLLGKVNREFRNSLKIAYEQNLEKNRSFFYYILHLQEVLSGCGCKYAMLKGAYLCKRYPDAYRTSNDIDLLVNPKDVTKIGEALSNAGFKQGNVRNGCFVPATRREIIESKMTRGETVPYIKKVFLPKIDFMEVDINFSLDYKPGDTKLLEELIENSATVNIDDLSVPTLREDDFFIHLCNHLYKEATTLPWVEMKRDMTLYKYADIYMLLNNASAEYIDTLFSRAKTTDMEKICAFTVRQMSELFYFENEYAVNKADEILESNKDFIHTVISPKDGTRFIYQEKDISSRFFSDERAKMLSEVKI